MRMLVLILAMIMGAGCATVPTGNQGGNIKPEVERAPSQVSDLCDRLKGNGFFLPDEGFPYYAKKSKFPAVRINQITRKRANVCEYYELVLDVSDVYLDDKVRKNERFNFTLQVTATNLAFDKLKSRDVVSLTLVSGAGVIVNSAEYI